MTGRVVLVATSEQALAGAAAAFLAQPSLARSTRRSYDQTLTRLASETGGEYFRLNVGFDSPLKKVEGETSGYYLITYHAPHAAQSRRHTYRASWSAHARRPALQSRR